MIKFISVKKNEIKIILINLESFYKSRSLTGHDQDDAMIPFKRFRRFHARAIDFKLASKVINPAAVKDARRSSDRSLRLPAPTHSVCHAYRHIFALQVKPARRNLTSLIPPGVAAYDRRPRDGWRSDTDPSHVTARFPLRSTLWKLSLISFANGLGAGRGERHPARLRRLNATLIAAQEMKR